MSRRRRCRYEIQMRIIFGLYIVGTILFFVTLTISIVCMWRI